MTVSFVTGTVIEERYTLIESLGEGGMGSVYKAREAELDRLVAIKLIHLSLVGDENARMRFRREGRALSALSHPHILQFYRFGLWQRESATSRRASVKDELPLPYIVMEYLKGVPLKQIIQGPENPLAASRALKIAIQICDGMQFAHDGGVVHRDLSVNNIMLVSEHDDDFVKIIDFGLSVLSPGITSSDTRTKTGMVVGSIYYMSPEQCKGGRADHRSDIYSLGCILYQMITGTAPFDSDNPIALLRQHCFEDAPPLTQFVGGEDIPCGLQNAIKRALCKEPDRRYQSMSEFRRDLELIEGGKGTEIIPPGLIDQPSFALFPSSLKQMLAICAAICLSFAIAFCLARSARKHSGNEHPLPATVSSIHRLRTVTELGSGTSTEDRQRRVEYYLDWLNKYQRDGSPEVANAMMALSTDLNDQDPAAAHKWWVESRKLTREIFDRSIWKRQIEVASNAVDRLAFAFYQFKPPKQLAEELRQMIALIDQQGANELISPLIACRDNLSRLYVVSADYKSGLIEVDKALESGSHCSLHPERIASLMITRAKCLSGLHRKEETLAQLKSAAEFCWNRSQPASKTCEIIEAAYQDGLFQFCIDECLFAEPVFRSSPADLAIVYKMHAASLLALKRYAECFELLSKNSAELLCEQGDQKCWNYMLVANERGKLKKQSIILKMLQEQINSMPSTASFADIAADRLLQLSWISLNREDLVNAGVIRDCAHKLLEKCTQLDEPIAVHLIQCARNCVDKESYREGEDILVEVIGGLKRLPGDQRRLISAGYDQLLFCAILSKQPEKALDVSGCIVKSYQNKPSASTARKFARVLVGRADIFRSLSRFDEARKEAYKARSIAEEYRLEDWKIFERICLGQIAQKDGCVPEAEELFLNAEQELDSFMVGKPVTIGTELAPWHLRLFGSMASIYSASRNSQKCSFYLEKYLQVARQVDPNGFHRCLEMAISLYDKFDQERSGQLKRELALLK